MSQSPAVRPRASYRSKGGRAAAPLQSCAWHASILWRHEVRAARACASVYLFPILVHIMCPAWSLLVRGYSCIRQYPTLTHRASILGPLTVRACRVTSITTASRLACLLVKPFAPIDSVNKSATIIFNGNIL